MTPTMTQWSYRTGGQAPRIDQKVLYLTINDAPSRRFLQKIEFLEERRVPAFFFCIGTHIEKHRDEVIAAVKRVCQIGNHSYSHRRFSQLSFYECSAEIQRCEDIIDDIYADAGVARTCRLFRFPFGDKGWDRKVRLPKRPLKALAERLERRLSWALSRRFCRRLQLHLAANGYSQPPWPATLTDYYQAAGLACDHDVYWTFDSQDYRFQGPSSFGDWLRDGDYQEVFLGHRHRRGRLFGDQAADVLLAHDYDDNFHQMRELVDLCIEDGAHFESLV